MKKKICTLMLITIIMALTGCYKQINKEAGLPVEFKTIALDAPPPSPDEADVVITTSTKKGDYLFRERSVEKPYIFTLSINGREFKESILGIEKKEPGAGGQGIYYELKKRIRLKPGSYTFWLKHEEDRPAEIRLSLEGGRLHLLDFKPIYGPIAFGRIKKFSYGIKYYKISLDGAEILIE